jgi:transposase
MSTVYAFSNFVGVDVAKNTLEIKLPGRKKSINIDNLETVIQDFFCSNIDDVGKTLVVMEATGGCERTLVRTLAKMNIACAVANPKQVRDFARGCGELAKTDAIDACVILRFAEVVKPSAYVNKTSNQHKLEEYNTRRRQLIVLTN